MKHLFTLDSIGYISTIINRLDALTLQYIDNKMDDTYHYSNISCKR